LSIVTILPFQPSDQAAARALVLAGLVEHWGWLDETKNPDLDDIAASYANGCFLCAWQDERLVATGALLPAGKPDSWQVVRMSVAAELRRTGLGKQMLEALEQEARLRGARRLVLETTATWHDVIAFYLRRGYRILPTSQFFGSMLEGETGDVYFEKDLS
jgi:GNAT superfamily N-acetyltransferase